MINKIRIDDKRYMHIEHWVLNKNPLNCHQQAISISCVRVFVMFALPSEGGWAKRIGKTKLVEMQWNEYINILFGQFQLPLREMTDVENMMTQTQTQKSKTNLSLNVFFLCFWGFYSQFPYFSVHVSLRWCFLQLTSNFRTLATAQSPQMWRLLLLGIFFCLFSLFFLFIFFSVLYATCSTLHAPRSNWSIKIDDIRKSFCLTDNENENNKTTMTTQTRTRKKKTKLFAANSLKLFVVLRLWLGLHVSTEAQRKKPLI